LYCGLTPGTTVRDLCSRYSHQLQRVEIIIYLTRSLFHFISERKKTESHVKHVIIHY